MLTRLHRRRLPPPDPHPRLPIPRHTSQSAPRHRAFLLPDLSPAFQSPTHSGFHPDLGPPPILGPSPARQNTNIFLPFPTPTPPTPASTIPAPAVARPAPSGPALSRVTPIPTPPAPVITPAAPPSVARVTVDPRPSQPLWTAPDPTPPPPDSPEAALDFLRRALQEGRPEALSHLGRFTLDYCEQPTLLVQAIHVARDRELALLMNLLDRGQQDSRAIEPAFRTLAETVGARRRESEILQLINEVANRECCLRRSYLAATLEGLTVGLDRAGSPPIVNAEAVQRLREFTTHSDLDLAVAAAAASQFFRAPDPNQR